MLAAKAKPQGGHRGASRAVTAECLDAHRHLYGNRKPGRLPDNWRLRLPSPEAYYSRRVKKLGKPNGKGWAVCRCPFHQPDEHPSAAVNFQHGGFKCQACGEHHDLVGFHEALTGLKFPNSARDLIGLKVVS